MHSPTLPRFSLIALAAVLAASVLAVEPAAAEGGAPGTDRDSIPSFAESPGCQGLDGIRGPTHSSVGNIPLSAPIYGPWGDFFGRTKQQVQDDIVAVQLPGMVPGTKPLYIHERVLPAFEQVVANLEEEAAQGHTYAIRDEHTFSLNHSTVPPRRHFSFHAVGMAIDVNSTTNPYRSDNVLITDMPQWFVQAWRDAGWCWGGDWQTIKDPMHFSWKGPIHTPGYEMPPPYPPLVGTANFTAAIDLDVRLPAGGTDREFVTDIDRDGAIDIVRVEDFAQTGQQVLRAAVARHSHETCIYVAPTESDPVYSEGPAFMEDLSGDGRPDLVYVNDGAATIELEVFTLAQNVAMARSLRTTGVAPASGDTYLFDDHDRDGAIDLYVVRDGSPATMEIWLGPTFTTKVVDVTLSVSSSGMRFDLGDRDVDGKPDLYAFAADGTLTVHQEADDFAPLAPVATSTAGSDTITLADLDGDGHSDVILMNEDGNALLLRGGASTHSPGAWYLLPEDNWVPGDGCTGPVPSCMRRPATIVGSDDNDTGNWAIVGTEGDDVIVGLAGHDTIDGMGGNDRICGNRGHDIIRGGEGRDRLNGGKGNDDVSGGGGSDRVNGGKDDDTLYGNGRNDRLRGNAGVDSADGGWGAADNCDAETVVACELP